VPDDKVVPIFGICLGNQIMGLAAGCSSYKLPFGNRGHNQPVINTLTGKAFITPQNHGELCWGTVGAALPCYVCVCICRVRC
jgi:carbamoyl-phosphate synthase (ammonia)